MFAKFDIILSLCILNCVLVNGDCDSLFECVGTFFNDFTNIFTNNSEINGTKISVVDFGNIDGADQIIEDLKNIKNDTNNNTKTQSADILTFDLSKYLNEGLKKAEDWFKITQVKESETIPEVNKDDIETDFLNINPNITEEINDYFGNLNKSNNNYFSLPLKEINVSTQNNEEWTKNFYENIFKNNSNLGEKIHLFNENFTLKSKKKDIVLNNEIEAEFNTLLKKLNSTEINEKNVDKILDDINASFRKQDVILKINPLENNKDLTNITNKPNIIITKTIITTTFNNITTNPVNKKAKHNSTLNNFDYLNDYYEEIDDNSTDYPILDYIELYKDTTNEKVEYNPTEASIINTKETNATDDEYIDNFIADTSNVILINTSKFEDIPFETEVQKSNVTSRDIEEVVFPWIVAIFKRNETSNQFSYICDGALLSNKDILTAAQCVSETNSAFNPEDLLAFAGKRSLHKINSNEKVYKVKNIIINENYTSDAGVITNDLAILETVQEIEFNTEVQSVSNLGSEYSGKVLEEVTTAWNSNGSLVPVALKMINCTEKNVLQDNIYCANYYRDVTDCPSYGGIHAVKINTDWHLKGIFSGDITNSVQFCSKRTLYFTGLKNYTDWLNEYLHNK